MLFLHGESAESRFQQMKEPTKSEKPYACLDTKTQAYLIGYSQWQWSNIFIVSTLSA